MSSGRLDRAVCEAAQCYCTLSDKIDVAAHLLGEFIEQVT
jgi:hypothetical protein